MITAFSLVLLMLVTVLGISPIWLLGNFRNVNKLKNIKYTVFDTVVIMKSFGDEKTLRQICKTTFSFERIRYNKGERKALREYIETYTFGEIFKIVEFCDNNGLNKLVSDVKNTSAVIGIICIISLLTNIVHIPADELAKMPQIEFIIKLAFVSLPISQIVSFTILVFKIYIEVVNANSLFKVNVI